MANPRRKSSARGKRSTQGPRRGASVRGTKERSPLVEDAANSPPISITPPYPSAGNLAAPLVEYTPTTQEQIHELLCREYEKQNLPDEEIARRAALGLRLLGFGMDGKVDSINKRSHYNQSKFEVIEILDDHSLDFYRGNIVKYLLRAPFTGNPLEQLKKAQYYLNRLVRLTSLNQGPFGLQMVNEMMGEES